MRWKILHFNVSSCLEILFAEDMSEMRKKWSWIMSLTVSLFMGLSPSNHPPPPNPMHWPSLNRLTQIMWAEPVAQTSITSNFLQKALTNQVPVSLHAFPRGHFCFVLRPPLPVAQPIWLAILQALHKFPGLTATSPQGLKGVNLRWLTVEHSCYPLLKKCVPYQGNIYPSASREFSASRHCCRPQWLTASVSYKPTEQRQTL